MSTLGLNAIINPGADKTDFELRSLAVSAINGCGAGPSEPRAAAGLHQMPDQSMIPSMIMTPVLAGAPVVGNE
jgi:hypothetical protein